LLEPEGLDVAIDEQVVGVGTVAVERHGGLGGVKLGFARALAAAESDWAQPVVPVNGVSATKIWNWAVYVPAGVAAGSVK
jgi:hypothetical protein